MLCNAPVVTHLVEVKLCFLKPLLFDSNACVSFKNDGGAWDGEKDVIKSTVITNWTVTS